MRGLGYKYDKVTFQYENVGSHCGEYGYYCLSEMLRLLVWWIFTDITEECAVSKFRADKGRLFRRDVGKYVPDYTE